MTMPTGVFRADLFAGRRVLVSGASSGIGLAIATGFATLGAEVIATGSSNEKLEARRRDATRPGLRFERLDVRSSDDIARFVASLPGLDVLVNAQGIARPDREFEDEAFLEVMDVNLVSVMRLCAAAHPLLKASRGAIINISSMLSYLGAPDVPAYGASKTGLLGLTRSLAHAYGPDGIRVNAISPGYHRTAMTQPLWSVAHSHDAIARHAALGRWGTTDDLVGAALFLASDAAAYVTGADLPVDGGYVVGVVNG